jgi:hypothetical protein
MKIEVRKHDTFLTRMLGRQQVRRASKAPFRDAAARNARFCTLPLRSPVQDVSAPAQRRDLLRESSAIISITRVTATESRV